MNTKYTPITAAIIALSGAITVAYDRVNAAHEMNAALTRQLAEKDHTIRMLEYRCIPARKMPID